MAVFIDPNRDLRSPFMYLVANLAMADLLVGLVTEPVSAYYHIKNALGAIDYDVLSTAVHMPFFISCTASVLSLAALTVDRYVAITAPFRYRANLSPLRALFACVMVWTISLTFPFAYLYLGFFSYAFLFANTAVVLTFLVLLFAYVRIYKIFRRQVREWDSLHDSTEDNRAKKIRMRWEQKITKTLLIIGDQIGEASRQYYARGMMLPLSPVAKKSRETKSILNGAPEESDEIKDGKFAFTIEQEDNGEWGIEDDDIGPDANFPSENNLQRKNNRNAMLKRLSDCFILRQKRANLGAQRHRVLGFFPKLCTIHENASEMAQDMEENYQLAVKHEEHESTGTNDQKIAALHQDIKELWKRLENVEKEFAWARGALNLAQHTKLK
ncbi:Histamine H2 receptor [Stylophora pistillata]|uniref:Histamine H2 receptor n=1 Tax=Stylophora pistillata TaxID=50429 RepID=A0A2B4SUQ1_STYPI|nr:Histamine H2 receptor [Stylophora pistillata]